MRDEAQLLPCPFCLLGGDAHLVTNPQAEMSWVACRSCGLEAPAETGVSAEEAVRYWNQRTTPPEPVDARAALEPFRLIAEWIEKYRWADSDGPLGVLDGHELVGTLQMSDFRRVLSALSTANAPTDALDPIPSSERELLPALLFKAIAHVHANGGGVALPSAVDLMDPVHQSDLDRLHEYANDVATAYFSSTTREPALDLHTRNEALEEAAKVAEAHQTNGKRMFGHKGRYDDAAEEIATAIRTLKREAPDVQ